MGLFRDDGDGGYDRSDEDDDFKSWSDKRRAASAPPVETPPEKAPPKTLTQRLAQAATDRGNARDDDSAEQSAGELSRAHRAADRHDH